MKPRAYYLILRFTGKGHYAATALVWRRYVKPMILAKARRYPSDAERPTPSRA